MSTPNDTTDAQGVKTCSKCGEAKALGEFPYRRDKHWQGYRTTCETCNGHRRRARRQILSGDISMRRAAFKRKWFDHFIQSGGVARFKARIVQGDPDECWIWPGAYWRNGYGVFGVGKNFNIGAHRASYAVFHGDPGDLCVCHSCDNRACVNPAHLWLGTVQDNHDDMWAKGRAPRRGMFSDSQVVEIRTRFANGETARAIAADLGITKTHAWAIATKKVYRRVE